MKHLLWLLATLLLVPAAFAQRPTTPPTGSPLRKAILDGLRPTIQKDLGGISVQFVVKKLSVLNGWAFLNGEVQKKGGGKINFLRTKYAEAQRSDAFDGPSIFALVRQRGKTWKCVAFAIGPTDVAYATWGRDYGAPRQIFPYQE